MKTVLRFIKKDPVLSIAALCAVVTAFFVPPDRGYIAYMDLRVLCLLLCLMAVVAGFGSCGAFSTLAYALLRRCRRGQVLGFVLVMLPFFTSMLVTNDVALLTFVPFTMLLLGQMGCHKSVIPTLVLQTVAANLGSMATPVGNPQNLYLYGYYTLSPVEFFSAMLPLTTACFMGLGVASLFLLPKVLPTVEMEKESLHDTEKLLIYAALFILCLTAVFRWMHYAVVTVIVVLVLFLLNRSLLKKVDYLLLVTFVCFFILSGNLGRMDGVRQFLQSLLERSTLLTSLGASQVISNVPAAVLLSEFTSDWRGLLQGVNIGGLGTPCASLASLITLKLYTGGTEKASVGRFLAVFTAVNLVGIILLLLLV